MPIRIDKDGKTKKERTAEYSRKHRADNPEYYREFEKHRYERRKESQKEYRQRYYQEHKEEISAKQKIYAEAHKEQIKSYLKEPCRKMLYSARERTKKLGLPACDLTLNFLRSIYPEYCPILGTKLEQNNKPQPNSPSLDRIIPALGYTIGNVQIISNKANMMKQNATNEELLLFAEWIARNINNTNE